MLFCAVVTADFADVMVVTKILFYKPNKSRQVWLHTVMGVNIQRLPVRNAGVLVYFKSL